MRRLAGISASIALAAALSACGSGKSERHEPAAEGASFWGDERAQAERLAASISRRIKNESSAQLNGAGVLTVFRTGPARLTDDGRLIVQRAVCERKDGNTCRKSAMKQWTLAAFKIALADLDPGAIAVVPPATPKGERGHFVAAACLPDRSCTDVAAQRDERPCKGDSCAAAELVERYGDSVTASLAFLNHREAAVAADLALDCRSEVRCEAVAKDLGDLVRIAAARREGENAPPAAADNVPLAGDSAEAAGIIAALNSLGGDISYSFYDDFLYETRTTHAVRRFSVDEAGALLRITESGEWKAESPDFEEGGRYSEETALPTGEVAAAVVEFPDAALVPGGGRVANIRFDCADGAACIRKIAEEGGVRQAPIDLSHADLPCAAGVCEAMKANLEKLLALARGEPSGAPASAQPASAAAAILARLRSATANHVYRRGTADQSVRDFGYPSKKNGRFWFAIRDHRYDAAFLEYEAPLDKVRFRTGDVGDPNLVAIDCVSGDNCITVYDGDGEFADGAHNNDEISQSVAGTALGCRADKCESIRADLEALAAIARGSTAPPTIEQGRVDSAAGREATHAKPASGRAASAAARVTSRIDRQAASVAGLPSTQGIALLGDGRIALHTDSCAGDRSGCGPNAVTDNEIVVAFAAADIDAASPAIQATGSGYAVVFACKAGLGACMRSPDGRLQFAGYGLACKDQTECNRLVIDLSSLLAAAVE